MEHVMVPCLSLYCKTNNLEFNSTVFSSKYDLFCPKMLPCKELLPVMIKSVLEDGRRWGYCDRRPVSRTAFQDLRFVLNGCLIQNQNNAKLQNNDSHSKAVGRKEKKADTYSYQYYTHLVAQLLLLIVKYSTQICSKTTFSNPHCYSLLIW